MKTIICLCGSCDTGKTSTILNLANELSKTYNVTQLHKSGDDICSTVQYNGITLGLASQGDPDSTQDTWLTELTSLSCDIIVCTSRTKGSTADVVRKHAKEKGYGLIRLNKPYVRVSYGDYERKEMHETINQSTARTISDLINKLINK